MPILIEGVCVLLKKGSVIERYQGGYGQFIFDLQDQSKLIECNDLISIGFNSHEEARRDPLEDPGHHAFFDDCFQGRSAAFCPFKTRSQTPVFQGRDHEAHR